MIRHRVAAAVPLAALLVWAPLPFGSVTPGFSAVLQILAFALLAASPWLVPRQPLPRAALAAAAALAALAALGLLQSLAWPEALARALSPEHVRLARESAALAGAGAPERVALSVAPGASRAAALDWLLPAAGLLLAARLGASRRARRVLAFAVLAAAAFQVLYGARAWLADSTEVWGIATALDARRLRGTFVNPNHLALALALALAVGAAALAATARHRAGRSAERRLLRLVPLALVCALLLAGLLLTGSRTGLLAACGAAAVQAVLATRTRRGRRAVAGAAVALALVAGALAASGREGALERLAATSGGDTSVRSRLAAAQRTLDLWARFPATGSGLGSFLAAFPLVQGPDLPGIWRHAHDDWLELGATAGLLGAALLLLGLGAAGRGLVRAARGAADGEERAAVVAAAGALVAAGLQAVTDFGLTLPANAWTLSVVVGAALAVGVRPGGRAGVPEAGADQPPAVVEDQLDGEPSSKPSTNSG